MSEEVCVWVSEYEESDVYTTSCGDAFYFTDGNAEDNNFNYCPFCGKRIEVAQESQNERKCTWTFLWGYEESYHPSCSPEIWNTIEDQVGCQFTYCPFCGTEIKWQEEIVLEDGRRIMRTMCDE